MQLVAYGAKSRPSGNPQITFWLVNLPRHFFAMESIEQTGARLISVADNCTVSRNGDLAYCTYLQVTLPEVSQNDAKHARWLDCPGEQLIQQVEVEIGGQRIDRQYGDWMPSGTSGFTSEQARGYNKMVGNTPAYLQTLIRRY